MDPDRVKLVTAAQAGDTMAFSGLVQAYYSMVHGLAVSGTGEWGAAADLTQEVFLVAWQHVRSLKHPQAFPIWLRRIARNCASNWRRSQHYRHRLADRVTETPPEAHDPAAAAARNECLERIRHHLRALSPKLREAVVLYYLEGNTMKESADALGVTEEAAKKRVQMGCARLRKTYEREGDLEQLLPYSPRPHAERILAGLAVGPAGGLLSAKRISSNPVRLAGHHLFHGGSLNALRDAGLLAALAKSDAVALIVAVPLLVGAGAAVAYTMARPPAAVPCCQEPPPGVPCYQGVGLFTTEHWGDPKYGGYVRVDQVFPGYPAHAAGVRDGDRVVRINGRTVYAGHKKNPEMTLRGPAGTHVRLTIQRTSPDGAEQELEFEVTRGYVPDQVYEEACAAYEAAIEGAPAAKE